MKNRTLVFLVMAYCLFTALAGCSSTQRHEQMQSAYALLNLDPDSALNILNGIDYRSFSEANKAYYSLVYTIAQDKSGFDVNKDSLLQYAKVYYDEHPSDTLYAKFCYYLGKYHHLNDEFKQAEDYLNRSIKKAESDKDYYTQYLAWNRLSKSLKFSNPNQAIVAAKKSYEIYADYCESNLYNKVYLLIGIGDGYRLSDHPDSMFYYYSEALEIADSIKDNELIAAAHQSFSMGYMEKKSYGKQMQHIQKAWALAPVHDEHLSFALAYAYYNMDSIPQCLALLEELCQSETIKSKYVAYREKANSVMKLNHSDQIKELVDSAFYFLNTSNSSVLKERTAYYEDKLQLQKENELIHQKVEFQKMFLWFLFILSGTGAVFAYLLYRSRKARVMQMMEMQAFQQKAQEEKLKLQQRNSENQIKYMRKYLLSKVHFQDELDKVKTRSDNHIDLDEETWHEIELFLNACENGFVRRLHETFPHLTEDDLRFCMLIRLDFSIRDLGKVYRLVDVSVKQKQNKFKTKLKLEDSKLSLRKFIQTF